MVVAIPVHPARQGKAPPPCGHHRVEYLPAAVPRAKKKTEQTERRGQGLIGTQPTPAPNPQNRP